MKVSQAKCIFEVGFRELAQAFNEDTGLIIDAIDYNVATASDENGDIAAFECVDFDIKTRQTKRAVVKYQVYGANRLEYCGYGWV